MSVAARFRIATAPVERARKVNPFATRWVRPGAVQYVFPPDLDAGSLMARLRGNNWRGAIVGPHGSGKSTLLAMLMPAIEAILPEVKSIGLHDVERRLPRDFLRVSRRESAGGQVQGLIVVDGYEQLSWWEKRRLERHCRRNGWGLLVTAHEESAARRLPLLLRTEGDLAVVQQLVEGKLPPHGGVICIDDVANAFAACRGNVRETLFALYDLYEQRRRKGG
jgi:hypothetical protein